MTGDEPELDIPVAPLTSLSSLLRPDRIKLRSGKLNPKSELAREIYEAWGISFPRVMKLITEKGIQCVREVFEEVKKASCKNPPALFLWRLRNIKVDFKEI